jgi:hypothetical protein
MPPPRTNFEHAHSPNASYGSFMSQPPPKTPNADTDTALTWGNGHYLNLTAGQPIQWQGHQLELQTTTERGIELTIDNTPASLPLCRQALPSTINDIRLFCADTRPAASLTTDTFTRSRRIHGCLSADALICASSAHVPLLDPDRFCFPISRSNTFHWSMDEASHTWAYLAPNRSHEGIDIDLSSQAGGEPHVVVAMEASRVVRLQQSRNGCVILQSTTQPHIYYTYQHMHGPDLQVAMGQVVARGTPLGWAHGDRHWPHLHLSICVGDPNHPPSLNHRYNNLLNAFPQLYETYHGDLSPRPVQHSAVDWIMGPTNYWTTGNRLRTNAYSPLLGYGWELGDWCKPNRVPCAADTTPHDGLRLNHSLFPGTPAESHAPDNTPFTFRIDLQPGTYTAQITCGDPLHPTSLELHTNNTIQAHHTIPAGSIHPTPPTILPIHNGIFRLNIPAPTTIQRLQLAPS